VPQFRDPSDHDAMKAPPLQPVEEQMMFWQEHSTAIAQFAQLELGLAQLVSAGVDEGVRKAMHAAFFGIEAFRSKLEFADRFVRIRVEGSGPLTDRWTAVHALCKRSSEGRNKLAHWVVIHHTSAKPGEQVVLVPPSMNPKDKMAAEPDWKTSQTPPSYALGVRRLVEIRYGFFDATIQLRRFLAEASGSPDPFPSYTTRAQAPTLAKLIESFRHLRHPPL